MSEPKRCATCRHFDGLDTDKRYTGVCELADSIQAEPKHSKTLAYAEDWRATASQLRVSPEYACNQWEGK